MPRRPAPPLALLAPVTPLAIPPGYRATWDGARYAFVPVEPPTLTKLAFRSRFTVAERVAIEAAAPSDPMVRVILADLQAADGVDVQDARTQAALDYLITTARLIAPDRRAALLARARAATPAAPSVPSVSPVAPPPPTDLFPPPPAPVASVPAPPLPPPPLPAPTGLPQR